jgi:hypothetical protein
VALSSKQQKWTEHLQDSRTQPTIPTHSYYDVSFASGNESHSAAGSADEDEELGDLSCCTFEGTSMLQ